MLGDAKGDCLFAGKKNRYFHALGAFVLVSSIALGLTQSTGPAGSNVQAVHAAGFRGQNVSIGLIAQSHARVTHEAFFDKDGLGNPVGNSHTHWFDATDLDEYEPTWHDTYVAGIACSRGGAAHPLDKGAAPEAELWSFRVTRPVSPADPNRIIAPEWVQDALDTALTNGCDVIVTAIQLGGTADGESLWSLMYDYYAYQYDRFFATASGNYASSVTIVGDSYNSLTTGGLITNAGVYDQVGAISSPGPTAGTYPRHKPEVGGPSPYQLAPSVNSDTSWATVPGTTEGFTSYAVPHTAGAAAVLLSYANSTPDADDGRNEVVRVVLVNAAFPNVLDNAGNGTVDPLGSSMPWEKHKGYGRLDVYSAFEILSSARISPGSSNAQAKGWGRQTLGGGQQQSYFVQGARHERLVVTLAWNRRVVWTDPHGPGNGIIEPGELAGYTANLDLQVYDPDGIAAAGVPSPYNSKDNLEKLDLLLAKTGNYEIRIVNQTAGETAAYGLAFEVLEPLAGDVHVDYVVDVQDMTDFADWWLYSGCTNSNAGCYDYNLSPSAAVELSDFAVLSGNWLGYDGRYYRP